jgi:hypothetical protein
VHECSRDAVSFFKERKHIYAPFRYYFHRSSLTDAAVVELNIIAKKVAADAGWELFDAHRHFAPLTSMLAAENHDNNDIVHVCPRVYQKSVLNEFLNVICD